ncbi:MAG TPA: C13 family peptidase, partial [Rhodocyclaceae bacterium]|nr:C13 family peptidase [Rhodocyclaceae bacterium]
AGVLAGALYALWGQDWAAQGLAALGLMVGVAALIWLSQFWQRRALYRQLVATQPPAYRLTLNADGVQCESERGHSCLHWSALVAIDVHAKGVHLHFSGFQVLWVPRRLFADGEAYAAFLTKLEQFSGRPLADVRTPTTEVTDASALAAWMNNVVAGFAFLAFRPGAAGRLHSSVNHYLALAISILALDVFAGWVRIDGPSLFNWAGVPATLLLLFTLLVAAWATAKAEGLPDSAPLVVRGAVALTATWLALSVIGSGLAILSYFKLIPDAGSSAGGALIIWGMLLWGFAAMMVALARSLELLPESRVGAGLAVIGLFVAPLFLTSQQSQLWTEDYRRDDDESAAMRERWQAPVREAAIYAQPGLLADAIEQLQPGQPGVPEVFLLALAGHGSQDVFKREVEAVQTQFEQQFGTRGHALALINNPETVEDTPIATVTALKQGLRAIGERMNRDEDVLVLFMTSHGSSDYKFDLSLYPYRLDDLTPEVLRAAIEEAGIRYRVVVVSACYSGGFIKPLAAPEALVITAARADRNSHGCSHEADRTFFGRAYFDEALQETRSFRRAFDAAIVKIDEREKAEKLTPSEPQIAEGAAIGAVLARLEDYWKRRLPGGKQP